MRVEIETQSMDVGFVRLPLPAVRCVVSRPCVAKPTGQAPLFGPDQAGARVRAR
jgi:hypothetical protein